MGELALPIRSPPARVFAGRLWSDERLARAVAGGDSRAFALLYQRHHQALYRYCRLILRDEHDAQDALQSAMTRAFGSLRARERDLAVRPWLFRIAHNEAVTVLRKRRPTSALTETLEAADSGVEETLERRERLATLVGDLQELSERQRAALVMRELSGLSIEEIADALSSSGGATKQVLFEARGALHDFAEGRAMECERIRRAISDEDRRALRGRKLRAHLRACAGCRDFQGALAMRRGDLHALAPALAPLAATAMLGRLLAGGTAGGHAGGLAVGSGGLTAGSGGLATGSGGAMGSGGLAAGTGGLAGSGGLAAGSGAAAGGSAGGVAAVSLATKVAIVVAVAATAAGGTRVALVHSRSGHGHPAARPGASPALSVHAKAVGPGGTAGARAARATSNPSNPQTAHARAASQARRTTATGHDVVVGSASGPLAAGALAAPGSAGRRGLGQAPGRSATQPGGAESGTPPGRGAASRSTSHRRSSSTGTGTSDHRSGSPHATPNGVGKPGTSNRPASTGGHGQSHAQAGPPASQRAAAGSAPQAADAPAQGQGGQSVDAPADRATEAPAGSHGRP